MELRTKSKIPITNHYPFCVTLELTSTEIENSGLTRHRSICIGINILFGEEKIDLMGGSIRFGVRRGELLLELENAECPLEERNFFPYLPETVELNYIQEHQKSTEMEESDKSSAKLAISAPISIRGEKFSRESIGSSNRHKISFVDAFHVIRTKGPSSCPIWVFESVPGKRILQGGIRSSSLCCLNIENREWALSVKFSVNKSDIIITGVDGIYPDSISNNKKGIINSIISKLVRRKIGTVLSEGGIKYV